MKSDYSDQMDMYYGHALIAFGEKAVNVVINQVKWVQKYPILIERITSTDSTRFGVLLPGEIVYEIAGRKECSIDFYADPDDTRLYAVERVRKWPQPSAAETRGYKKVPNQAALLSYGSYCLFKAVDSSYGIKGEK